MLTMYTATCRLDVDAHHLSDVIFGGALGYAVGYAYTLHHRTSEGYRGATVVPYFDSRESFGLAARLTF
jgi:membrane-associated phospholipid phosphatase